MRVFLATLHTTRSKVRSESPCRTKTCCPFSYLVYAFHLWLRCAVFVMDLEVVCLFLSPWDLLTSSCIDHFASSTTSAGYSRLRSGTMPVNTLRPRTKPCATRSKGTEDYSPKTATRTGARGLHIFVFGSCCKPYSTRFSIFLEYSNLK